MTIPNPKNFCGGNFQDWLEVNLIENCNAKCPWCIERDGYHPDFHATTEEIAQAAIDTGKTNIILLGGEPLLYKEIQKLINILSSQNRKVWITTNGFLLNEDFILKNIVGITGINISIHHYDLLKNKNITKVLLNEETLIDSIKTLHCLNASVRMNCNTIKEYIDSTEEIISYAKWAKKIGADKIRFAELKDDEDEFVDLAKILNYKYGLSDNPFLHGCNSDCVIEGMPVNFRQMCGLQTSRREKPEDPEQALKEVLYYDGKIYQGWQKEKENKMDKKYESIIKKVTSGKLSQEEYESLLSVIEMMAKAESTHEVKTVVEHHYESAAGCMY